MRRLLAAALLALLVACGGGGASTPGTGKPVPKLGDSRPLWYGYYYGCSDNQGLYAHEQQGAASLWWATACGGSGTWATAVAQGLLFANAAGMRCAVLHAKDGLAYQGVAGAAEVLRDLHELAALPGRPLDAWPCLALYLVDEPDLHGYSDAQLRVGNAAIRAGLADLPALAHAPIGVFYACRTGNTPAFDDFDWPGCDDYDSGCKVTAVWDGYLARMRPDQVLLAISGGYSVSHQDPTCFKTWLSNLPPKRVVMTGFTWQATTEGGGIRDDPTLRPLYTAFGMWALGLGP